MNARRIGQLRLVSQRIVGSDFTDPAALVRWMLAMQGQDFPGAKWSVGLRTKGATNASVEAALAAGTIVRSWPMRGTLHFLPGEDLGWILALTTQRLLKGAETRREGLDLDLKTLERAREVAQGLLSGRRSLTREQMLAEWTKAKIPMTGSRGYHTLWHLSQTGTLCFGPPQGKEQSFVLLDEWVAKPRRLTGDEALGELARRYFQSHGPATLKDLGWWTKLTAAETKRALAVARGSLAELTWEGKTYYLAKDTEDRLESLLKQESFVAALPGFDEFILGYQDRSAVLPAAFSQRIVPGNNGMFMPTIIAGGDVIGTWRRAAKKKETIVTMEPFAPIPKTTRSRFATAISQWAAFWGVTAKVE